MHRLWLANQLWFIVSEMHLSAATLGNPQGSAPRQLQIPPTQGQFSSTKSLKKSPLEINWKGPPN